VETQIRGLEVLMEKQSRGSTMKSLRSVGKYFIPNQRIKWMVRSGKA